VFLELSYTFSPKVRIICHNSRDPKDGTRNKTKTQEKHWPKVDPTTPWAIEVWPLKVATTNRQQNVGESKTTFGDHMAGTRHENRLKSNYLHFGNKNMEQKTKKKKKEQTGNGGGIVSKMRSAIYYL